MLGSEFPSSNHVLPGTKLLPVISFPEFPKEPPTPSGPAGVAIEWASEFSNLVQASGPRPGLSTLFLESCCWRDLLCLSWNLRAIHGTAGITKLVGGGDSNHWRIRKIEIDTSSDLREPQIAPLDAAGDVKCIQSFIKIDTEVGKGRGVVRLLPDEVGTWKCYTLFTMLESLHGHPERFSSVRPQGDEITPGSENSNWQDLRDKESDVQASPPTALIIGSGHAGLTAAARLKQLGIRSLIIDRNPRVGDNWRNRYHKLVLHDPVWFDHMPYLEFPANWPVFSPKDKIAEWFEIYVKVMELNVWTSTTVTSCHWDSDDSPDVWTVQLEREVGGAKQIYTINPKHIVFATGASGKPFMPDIPGLSSFKGDRLVHSSDYHGLGNAARGEGKKVVIIGSCNSAHDVAQDYYDHGYSVTVVQRSSTFVVRKQTLIDVVLGGLYRENGPPIEDADILSHSFPGSVLQRAHIDATRACNHQDNDLLQRLEKAGFTVDSGPNRGGLWIKYLSRGGGYYIDIGTSELIASGKIKVKSGSIASVETHGVVLEDGTKLPADEVIFATGYGNMREAAEEFLGKNSGCEDPGDVWGFDEDEEPMRNIATRTKQPGFWYLAGNIALCRFYSKLLALQIKGVEEGMFGWGDP